MCVPCVFFDDSEPCPCRVLRDAGAGLLPDGVMETLAERYCMNLFLTCPIFMRVQRKLENAHQPAAPNPHKAEKGASREPDRQLVRHRAALRCKREAGHGG